MTRSEVPTSSPPERTGPPIYLDHHATTPCDPRVVAAMLPYFTEDFGNPASTSHRWGIDAALAVQAARESIARLVAPSAPDPREVIFTSGATEALNLAIKGLAEDRPERRRIVVSAFEHRAVLDTCAALAKRGFETVLVPVSPDGFVVPEDVARAVDAGAGAGSGGETLLVAVMAAQNEIGTLQPVAAIGALCATRGVPLLVDAVQAVGKTPLDLHAIGATLGALSAHKLYGPTGVGALWVRRRPPLTLVAQLDGGGHERGYRSGTLNVPGIVGFGVAAELARSEGDAEATRLLALRTQLWEALQRGFPDVVLNGAWAPRLAGNLHVALPGVEGAALMRALPELGLSAGSACTSRDLKGSHVLAAIGASDARRFGSLRIGLGRWTCADEVVYAGARITDMAGRLRRASP